MRILLDPGHVGGNFFDFRSFIIDGARPFQEGDFCFAWAEALASELACRGFATELSRGFGVPLRLLSEQERMERAELLSQQFGVERALTRLRVPRAFYSEVDPFTLLLAAAQNQADLVARAERLNEGNFDFALSLHLNGDSSVLRTTKNGIAGFTTQKSASHFAKFRQILTCIAKHTDLPLLGNLDLEGLGDGLYVEKSLTLLAHAHVPILLIEGPFQNNEREIARLTASLDVWTTDRRLTGRLNELVTAIVETLC